MCVGGVGGGGVEGGGVGIETYTDGVWCEVFSVENSSGNNM